MMRIARVVPILLVLTLSSAAVASAQTTATPGSTRNYAEFDFAATLGHKSDTAIGGGIAHVKNETTLSANSDLVQFGTDLNGSEVKPVFMIGAGATVGFAKRYFIDLSYRFGAVFLGDDSGVNKTQRAQVGIGVRF